MPNPQPLNYRTPAKDIPTAEIADLGAFNARTNIMWKGDFLFRIYVANDRLFFIKLGKSKRGTQQTAGHFGLIGAIVGHFAAKSAAKKATQKMFDYADKKPAELLKADKANHVTLLSAISEPTLNPGSFWASNKFGSFSFKNDKGKKKVYAFEDADNFQAAERNLPRIFGEKLALKARWDPAKKKVVKVS